VVEAVILNSRRTWWLRSRADGSPITWSPRIQAHGSVAPRPACGSGFRHLRPPFADRQSETAEAL